MYARAVVTMKRSGTSGNSGSLLQVRQAAGPRRAAKPDAVVVDNRHGIDINGDAHLDGFSLSRFVRRWRIALLLRPGQGWYGR
jgi:hypothetical protein